MGVNWSSNSSSVAVTFLTYVADVAAYERANEAYGVERELKARAVEARQKEEKLWAAVKSSERHVQYLQLSLEEAKESLAGLQDQLRQQKVAAKRAREEYEECAAKRAKLA